MAWIGVPPKEVVIEIVSNLRCHDKDFNPLYEDLFAYLEANDLRGLRTIAVVCVWFNDEYDFCSKLRKIHNLVQKTGDSAIDEYQRLLSINPNDPFYLMFPKLLRDHPSFNEAFLEATRPFTKEAFDFWLGVYQYKKKYR